jgi:hypothetical protein
MTRLELERTEAGRRSSRREASRAESLSGDRSNRKLLASEAVSVQL